RLALDRAPRRSVECTVPRLHGAVPAMPTFTPRTARVALVALRPVAEHVSRVARIMAGMRPKQRLSDARVDPEYFGLLTALLGALETLRSAGVCIQDPAAGLLDFPARRAGRAV